MPGKSPRNAPGDPQILLKSPILNDWLEAIFPGVPAGHGAVDESDADRAAYETGTLEWLHFPLDGALTGVGVANDLAQIETFIRPAQQQRQNRPAGALPASVTPRCTWRIRSWPCPGYRCL